MSALFLLCGHYSCILVSIEDIVYLAARIIFLTEKLDHISSPLKNMYATIIIKEKENVNFKIQALREVGGTLEGLGEGKGEVM